MKVYKHAAQTLFIVLSHAMTALPVLSQTTAASRMTLTLSAEQKDWLAK